MRGRQGAFRPRESGQVSQGGRVAACELERLTAFFAFPAEHWKHLRTTSVIESAFATLRLREHATRGGGSRSKGLLIAFKLLDMTQQH